MKLDVTILNVLKYTDKNDGKEKSRVGYRVYGDEAYSENDNYRGFTELSYFYKDATLFNQLTKEYMGQKCTLVFEERPNPTNPLKKYNVLKELVFKDNTITL